MLGYSLQVDAGRSRLLITDHLGSEVYGRGGGVGRGRACGVDLGVGVALGVGVGVGVCVAVAVAVAVGVIVGVGDGVPQGWYKITSSTYMAVKSPKPSWCTRNLIRTVCPAYDVISTLSLTNPLVESHR